MKKCPHCGFENKECSVCCVKCHEYLIDDKTNYSGRESNIKIFLIIIIIGIILIAYFYI